VGATLGSTGGSSTHVQTTSEMAQHNHAITDPSHQHAPSNGNNFVTTPGVNTYGAGSLSAGSVSATAGAVTGITINNAGSSTAMAWLQPTMMLGKILRVI
jgi:microcystin-dependent protein